MRYSSIKNNSTATILRGPRGRTRGILRSVSLGVRHQVSTFLPPEPEVETISPQERRHQHIPIPTNQLVNQVIQQSARTESPSAF